MVHKEKQKDGNEGVCLWNGKADAIAWYEDNYVIVEWKAVDLIECWNESKVYTTFLHQCLVYSRLLQLHLSLEKLPSILIVTINNTGKIIKAGKHIKAGYFRDFPRGCEKELEAYEWEMKSPVKQLSLPKALVKEGINVGLVQEEVRKKEVSKVLKEGCTVGELVAGLKFQELNICE